MPRAHRINHSFVLFFSLSQTGNVHFTYDSSGGRGGGGRDGAQYSVVRRPDVLVQASHHVLDSGETIVIPGNLASTPLSSHHNIDDGQVRTEAPAQKEKKNRENKLDVSQVAGDA